MASSASRGARPAVPARPDTHRHPARPRRTGRLTLAALTSLAVLAGCDDSAGPATIVSLSVSPADTTIFFGDSLEVQALVQYESGPGRPDSVTWTVSDPAVLALDVLPDGRARVRGLDRGTAYVIATVDEMQDDSAAVEVVRRGDVRWIANVGGGNLNHTAMDAQGRIYLSNSDGADATLYGLREDGGLAFAVPTCFSFYGPTVLPDGTAHTNSRNCVMAHEPDGSVKWTVPLGNSIEEGVAVAEDGSVALLHNVSSDTADFAVLTWIAPTGEEVLRDTLGVTQTIQENAVAIAANGDIYVPWQESLSPAIVHLSRVGSDGTTRWTVPVSGTSGLEGQTPAPVGDRVYVSYKGGMTAFDTTGTLLWQDASLPNATSSPVIDEAGNVYIQTVDVLKSYGTDGTVRWAADSLSFDCGFVSTTPTLLERDQLVVICGPPSHGEMCAVDATSGALIWRTALDANPRCGSPAVGSDGTVYTSFWLPEGVRLVALRNDVPPLRAGWPTEGGDMGRTRSR